MDRTQLIALALLYACAASCCYDTPGATSPAGSFAKGNPYWSPREFMGNQPNYCTRCGIRGGNQLYKYGVKIVDGVPAEPMEFPWRCILFTNYDIPDKLKFCSCSILSPEWVLTAAHCTYNIPEGRIIVNAGDTDISHIMSASIRSNSTLPNMLVRVAEVIEHENYNPATVENDVSLIRLAQPLVFAPNIQPVCLPYKFLGRSFDWETVSISGWGWENENGSLNYQLQKVDMTLIPVNACKAFHEHAGTTASIKPQNQVCSYHLPAGGKGQCRGDSGSSYDFLDVQTGRYYAVGVESFSLVQCAASLGPSLASRATYYLPWIDYITDNHFCG